MNVVVCTHIVVVTSSSFVMVVEARQLCNISLTYYKSSRWNLRANLRANLCENLRDKFKFIKLPTIYIRITLKTAQGNGIATVRRGASK